MNPQPPKPPATVNVAGVELNVRLSFNRPLSTVYLSEDKARELIVQIEAALVNVRNTRLARCQAN